MDKQTKKIVEFLDEEEPETLKKINLYLILAKIDIFGIIKKKLVDSFLSRAYLEFLYGEPGRGVVLCTLSLLVEPSNIEARELRAKIYLSHRAEFKFGDIQIPMTASGALEDAKYSNSNEVVVQLEQENY